MQRPALPSVSILPRRPYCSRCSRSSAERICTTNDAAALIEQQQSPERQPDFCFVANPAVRAGLPDRAICESRSTRSGRPTLLVWNATSTLARSMAKCWIWAIPIVRRSADQARPGRVLRRHRHRPRRRAVGDCVRGKPIVRERALARVLSRPLQSSGRASRECCFREEPEARTCLSNHPAACGSLP
jgi:hypothetical protein